VTAALLLAAVCQFGQFWPDPTERTGPPPAGSQAERRADLFFTAAVEDLVRAAEPAARPPEPYRSLIAGLGADCWTCRDLAGRHLERAVGTDPRWLLWGRRDPDPEIRLRCNNILRALTRCDRCGGTGFCRLFQTDDPEQNGPCRNCGHWAWEHPEIKAECWGCTGDGSGWNRGAFE
jgi:hypothetical protein